MLVVLTLSAAMRYISLASDHSWLQQAVFTTSQGFNFTFATPDSVKKLYPWVQQVSTPQLCGSTLLAPGIDAAPNQYYPNTTV